MANCRYLALAAFATLQASAATAQCRLCNLPSVAPAPTAPTGDVRLEVETSLSFDRMILFGAGNGAATIRPDGSSGTEGSVVELGPRATVGTIVVHGEPNRTVRIELPRRIELFSIGGGHITLDDVRTDVAAVTQLDAGGNMSFRFGGRLVLSGDCDGPYRGDLPISVEYQ
jgi:hypothetical protein